MDDLASVGKTMDKIEDVGDTAKVIDKVDDVAKGASGADIPKAKPNQVHHYASDKNSTYTGQFEDITKKYDLDLNGDWNKELLPHQGRHPNVYHDFIMNKMREIDNFAKGNQEIFLDLYESEIKSIIRDNTGMLYSDYWKSLK